MVSPSRISPPRSTRAKMPSCGMMQVPTRLKMAHPSAQKERVRRHGDAGKTAHFMQTSHKFQTSAPRHRFAARDAHFLNAERLHETDDAHDFLIAKQGVVRNRGYAVFRHAVDTAQVAAIRDGNAQIVDLSTAGVKHPRSPQIPGR